MKKSANTQVLQETIRSVLDGVELSQQQLARQVGVSSSVLSQWLRDLYPGNVEKMEGRLEAWLHDRALKAQIGGRLPGNPEWVAIPTAQEIYDTLEFAYLLSMQVIVYGSPGMSKTTTCRHFQREHSNVWLLTPTSVTGTKKGILTLLSHALKIQPGKSLTDLQVDCIAKMKGSHGLIIIDEGQQLAANSMDLMRQVAEEAGVGLAYVGNEDVYAQMTGGCRAMRFAQIFSRNTRRKHLILPEASDVSALCQAMNVPCAKVERFLFEISQTPGALRSVVKTIQLASMAADDGEISLPLVKDAWYELTGISC